MEIEARTPATSATKSLAMPEAGRKALFFALALPFVVRAAVRFCRHRHRRLDELVRRLRRAAPFRLGYLQNPRYLAGAVDRILALGSRRGRCWRRSLLLLDLWSRCGLEPQLCLGVARSANERQLHAWVTAGEHVDGAASHREVWVG